MFAQETLDYIGQKLSGSPGGQGWAGKDPETHGISSKTFGKALLLPGTVTVKNKAL